MSLITKVKAGGVSSLSDARFFAGMGVDWIGFDVNPLSEAYVSVEQYRSFVGWIAGPKRVLELPPGFAPDTLPTLLNEYIPDYLEVALSDVGKITTDHPLFARTSSSTIPIDTVLERVDYVVLHVDTDPINLKELVQGIAKKSKVLLHVAPDYKNIKTVIETLPISGISLQGSKESQTGIKVYDYADLLESIEAED